MVSAISDKLSGIVPDWMKEAWAWVSGEDSATETGAARAAPPIQSLPGYAALPSDQQTAAAALQQASAAGALPTAQYMTDLQDHAVSLQSEIGAVQSRIDQLGTSPMAATMAVPMRQEMSGLQEELELVEHEMVAADQRATDLTDALKVINQTQVAPAIDTTSVDEAMNKIARMSAQLSAVGTPRAVQLASASAGPDGNPGRDRGGPVRAGVPYLVGERSPEIFVPGVSGSILPGRVLKAAMAMTALAGQTAAQVSAGPSETEIAQTVDRRPAISTPTAAPQITRQGDTIAINIYPQQGMSVEDIGREVERRLARRDDARRADLHDGVDY